MGLRREGRELALQILYAVDTNGTDLIETLRGFRETVDASSAVRQFAEELARGVTDHRDELDRLIEARSKNWAISRMPLVDLNVMRIATFELLYCPDIPKKVTINEAIEIVRSYGDKDSPSFVNGILDDMPLCSKNEEKSQ